MDASYAVKAPEAQTTSNDWISLKTLLAQSSAGPSFTSALKDAEQVPA